MTTTFDPAKKSALVTLSGGNLTATKADGAANYASALSTSGHGTTKIYAEAKGNHATRDAGVGIAKARPADGDYVGFDTNGIALYSAGEVYHNNALAGTVTPAPVAGEWIGIAVDTGAQTISFRNVTQGGSFVPFSISVVGAGPLYFGMSAFDLGGVTANFDGAFVGTPPAGHARWDGTPLVPVFTTMPAAKGTIALTRNDAVLRRALKMPAAKATLVLTGIANAMKRAVPLLAATRAFVLTGNAANLIAAVARRMTAEPGAIALTGNAVSLARTTAYQMVADAGVLVLSGKDAALQHARRMLADTGVVALTGNAANLVVASGGVTLNAAPGTILLAGIAATLRIAHQPVPYEPVSFASLQNRTVHFGIHGYRKLK